MTSKNVPVPQSQSMYAGATQKTVAPLQWAVDSAQGNTKGLAWVDAEIVLGIALLPWSRIEGQVRGLIDIVPMLLLA